MNIRHSVRTVNGKPKREKQIEIECPKCHQQRWVYAYDIDHEICARCQRVDAGKASFAKLVDQHGYAGALAVLRDRIDARPSEPERIVRSFLSRMNVAFRTNVILMANERTGFIIDFEIELDGQTILIELDGHWHEANPKVMVRDAKLNRYFPDIIHIDADSSDVESEIASIIGLEHK